MTRDSDFVALLPAGGAGTRLAPFRYPKELLPVAYESSTHPGNGVRPRVVAEFAMEAFTRAGVRRCIVVVAPWKTELMHYFGDGSQFGMDVAYVYQEAARGLPHAIDLAYPWTDGRNVLFAMPDTVVRPSTCLATLKEMFCSTGADLAIGVFPSAEADRLGPVVLDGDDVTAIYDKVPNPPVKQVWGVAIWGPRLTDLLHAELAAAHGEKEPVLGTYFELARQRGLKVKGRLFHDGSYADIGTPEGLRACMEMWMR